MRRESSSAGKSSHHTSRHSRGTGSITYGIRTIVDKDPRFQSIPKTFRVPESEKVILPCYTENLGKEFYKVLTHYLLLGLSEVFKGILSHELHTGKILGRYIGVMYNFSPYFFV